MSGVIALVCSTFLICNEPVKDNVCKMPSREVLVFFLSVEDGAEWAQTQAGEEEGIPLNIHHEVICREGSI